MRATFQTNLADEQVGCRATKFEPGVVDKVATTWVIANSTEAIAVIAFSLVPLSIVLRSPCVQDDASRWAARGPG